MIIIIADPYAILRLSLVFDQHPTFDHIIITVIAVEISII